MCCLKVFESFDMKRDQKPIRAKRISMDAFGGKRKPGGLIESEIEPAALDMAGQAGRAWKEKLACQLTRKRLAPPEVFRASRDSHNREEDFRKANGVKYPGCVWQSRDRSVSVENSSAAINNSRRQATLSENAKKPTSFSTFS